MLPPLVLIFISPGIKSITLSVVDDIAVLFVVVDVSFLTCPCVQGETCFGGDMIKHTSESSDESSSGSYLLPNAGIFSVPLSLSLLSDKYRGALLRGLLLYLSSTS